MGTVAIFLPTQSYNLFTTSDPPKYSNSNSPNLCFCLLKGDKKTFLLVENIFWTNENVFLSPFNKEKQRFGELEIGFFGGSDVVNKLMFLVIGFFKKIYFLLYVKCVSS